MTKYKLPIFITTGFLLFGLGYGFLKGKILHRQGKHLYVVYDNVSGLKIGDNVKWSGLVIGKVGMVDQLRRGNKRGVIVELNITKGIEVSKNATAAVVAADYLGAKEININNDTTGTDAMEGDTLHAITELDNLENSKKAMFNVVLAIDSALHQFCDSTIRDSIRNNKKK